MSSPRHITGAHMPQSRTAIGAPSRNNLNVALGVAFIVTIAVIALALYDAVESTVMRLACYVVTFVVVTIAAFAVAVRLDKSRRRTVGPEHPRPR